MSGPLVRWVHRRLLGFYGRPDWVTTGSPLEELIATILSQHTSDINSDRAYSALRTFFPDWQSVREADVGELAFVIRSGGLAAVKAQRIQQVLRALTEDDGRVHLPDPLNLTQLMALPGVGRKTAACVLLFGAGIPAMPVDTHVHRVSLRLGVAPPRATPSAVADILESAVPSRDYYALHVNLIRLGREICKAPRPRCELCPLRDRCQTGRKSTRVEKNHA